MFGSTDFTLFGISWMLVGMILVALVRRYWLTVSEEGVKVGAALWMCLGFFLDKIVVGEVFVFPATPMGWMNLVLSLIIFFGAVMGLTPGETAGRVRNGVRRAVLGK